MSPRAESDLIASIRSRQPASGEAFPAGIGDDCAVLRFEPGAEVAVTTDLLVEDIDFRRSWMPPRFLGRKALAVSVSDLAAMGADPHACLLALAIPADLTDDYFDELIAGFLEGCERWHIPLVGGDLSEARAVSLAVTAFGSVPAGQAVYRRGARSGDQIVVIGPLGLSRMGLSILESENPPLSELISNETELKRWARTEERARAVRAHLLPEPPLDAGRWIRQRGLANAMIDVSDGLAADLLHILRESAVAGELDTAMLREAGNRQAPIEMVLNGGEDYALLITLSEERLEILERTYPSDLPVFHSIGRVVDGPPAIYEIEAGVRRPCSPRGFEHFQ